MLLDPGYYILNLGDHPECTHLGWLQLEQLPSGLGQTGQPDLASFLESHELAKQSEWAFIHSEAIFSC